MRFKSLTGQIEHIVVNGSPTLSTFEKSCATREQLVGDEPRQLVTGRKWSLRGRPWPRGHMLKSLALASKVKSLASKPQVLEDCPVLGLRTALIFELLKFCRWPEKNF